MASKANNQLPTNLPQLQNLIKRDRESYKEEFLQQFRHYESNMEVFQMNPSRPNKALSDLFMFLAQVAHCYTEELAEYPNRLAATLRQYSTELDQEMRYNMCRTLILLRNKRLYDPLPMLELFFELFRCQDKALRKFLCTYIVTDIRRINRDRKDLKVNKTLQNFMYSMLKDNNTIAARMSLNVMRQLYKRGVWADVRTVNVIASVALFSRITRVAVGALHFFLGKDDEAEEDSDDEDAAEQKKEKTELINHLRLANKVGKHTKKKEKKIKAATEQLKKQKKRQKTPNFNFSALHMIHDPQDLAEKLFKHLTSLREKLQVKLLYMNLISRIIGIHECVLLNFYPYLQRYLKPRQLEVTHMLLYTAQSSHPLVPPDVLEPVLSTIANNFISDRNSTEVMTVGLNAVREIVSRCPLSMNETLLQDLAQYKNNKDKGVHMAARSLITLFRAVNPDLLVRKDRGKPSAFSTDIPTYSKEYAGLRAPDHIPGAEVLNADPEELEVEPEGGGTSKAPNEGWESASDDDDVDGEWVNVHHSDEDVGAESAALSEMSKEERVAKAQAISHSRILTQEEHAAIKRAAIAKAVHLKAEQAKTKAQKRKIQDAQILSDDEETGEFLPLSSILFTHKHQKQSRAAMIAHAMEGKMDRDKFGHKQHNPEAGVSNKVKLKNKNFQMIKHKINRKNKNRSFRDKQLTLKERLKKKMK